MYLSKCLYVRDASEDDDGGALIIAEERSQQLEVAPLGNTRGRMSGKAAVAALVRGKGRGERSPLCVEIGKLEVEVDEVDEVFVWVRGKKKMESESEKERGGKRGKKSRAGWREDSATTASKRE